jgi:hypothetical protein
MDLAKLNLDSSHVFARTHSSCSLVTGNMVTILIYVNLKKFIWPYIITINVTIYESMHNFDHFKHFQQTLKGLSCFFNFLDVHNRVYVCNETNLQKVCCSYLSNNIRKSGSQYWSEIDIGAIYFLVTSILEADAFAHSHWAALRCCVTDNKTLSPVWRRHDVYIRMLPRE